jgi:hypothetical protein
VPAGSTAGGIVVVGGVPMSDWTGSGMIGASGSNVDASVDDGETPTVVGDTDDVVGGDGGALEDGDEDAGVVLGVEVEGADVLTGGTVVLEVDELGGAAVVVVVVDAVDVVVTGGFVVVVVVVAGWHAVRAPVNVVSYWVAGPVTRLASITTVHAWSADCGHVNDRANDPAKSKTCGDPSMVTVTRLLVAPPV